MGLKNMGGVKVFGVELFLLPDGSVLYNEIAPRPHNSGSSSSHPNRKKLHLKLVFLGDSTSCFRLYTLL